MTWFLWVIFLIIVLVDCVILLLKYSNFHFCVTENLCASNVPVMPSNFSPKKKPSLNSTLHWRQLQVPNNPLTTGCSWPDQCGIHQYIPLFLLASDIPIRPLFYRAQFSLYSFYLQSTRCSGDHRIMQWPKNFCPRLFRVSREFWVALIFIISPICYSSWTTR